MRAVPYGVRRVTQEGAAASVVVLHSPVDPETARRREVVENLEHNLKESHDLHTVGKKHGIFDKVFKKD